MASPDWTAELQEALWEQGKEYGVRLKVSEQVAIARAVASKPREDATAEDVAAAFVALHLPTPPRPYAKAVLASVRGTTAKHSLRDVLLGYRRYAIDALSSEYGGRTQGNEESLRNNLRTYLPQRGFVEARTGRGETDIQIPAPEEAIIETKVWTTRGKYEDGLEELGRYIHTSRPAQAFMVVFCDRDPLPPIVEDHRQAIAEERPLEGLVVPVIAVPFEVDQASKAAYEARRRSRSGG
jgi:hypothetical protein